MASSSYYKSTLPTKPDCDCKPPDDLPVVDSCPAHATGSPVMLAAGLLNFNVPLLSSSAIGAGSFGFALKYINSDPSTNSVDGVVGQGFNYSQNVRIVASGNNLVLQLPENTQEVFTDVGGGVYSSGANNSGATLIRSGSGSSEIIQITSRSGNISLFYGLDPFTVHPGRLKSLADRFGNTQTHRWDLSSGQSRLQSVTDSYGRISNFAYDTTSNVRLTQITDFLGRKVNFQYDTLGHVVAVVGPSIARGANGNTFASGTATVFQYDISNPRPERRNDLLKIWYPNQVAPYVSTDISGLRSVDVASVYAHATPRQTISYYNDPTDAFHYGKIQQLIESASGAGTVGAGAYGYIYLNSGLPANKIDPGDPIVSRTISTDRNGNQIIYDFSARLMLVHKQVFATRGKNSLQASSWEYWTKYNSHNQPLVEVMPEGDSVEYQYEDESNTIQINGMPYAPRIGLVKSITRKVSNTIGTPSRAASNGQSQTTTLYFYEPLFNHVCATIEERGNPIDGSGTFFTPQNGGTTPTSGDRSRYATITYYDYQKDTAATVQADGALQTKLNLSSLQIAQLISYVGTQMNGPSSAGPLPAGFEMAIKNNPGDANSDVNGDGTGEGTGNIAPHLGNVVKLKQPQVRQLVESTGTDPWAWQLQDRWELYTNNLMGQVTTSTNPEGNLTVYVRYPENNPDGDNDIPTSIISTQQYGRIQATYVDADPTTVMTLVGPSGDLNAFTGNKISRTNTPGSYLNLVTQQQGPTACVSCNYDPLGNVLTSVDARGNVTNYLRNELGEVYSVTSPLPYQFVVQTSYDANRNVIQIDTQDQVVLYDSTDPTDPRYAKFTPTGSGSTANVPMTAGPGGAVRPGWFSNLYRYDVLDNKIEEDIDATSGSTSLSLVTIYAYDFNQNLMKVTKPQGNLVEYDYDERDMQIATRLGQSLTQAGSVMISAFDGSGNLIDVVGPVDRGGVGTHQSVTINDAFHGSSNVMYVGDWQVQNTYDGLDRQILSTDAVGNQSLSTFDPGGRAIASSRLGPAGGATPTSRNGTNNVPLAGGSARYDEAGRGYEQQQDAFLNTGISGGSPTHILPSTRAATHTGGGLAANGTANNHTGTVTLTASSSNASYLLNRRVFDRAGRLNVSATDNGAKTRYTFDGVDRQLSMTDALGNFSTNTYDANGNVTGITRTEVCTIGSAIASESFASLMLYDVMNRVVVQANQGADGTISSSLSDTSTLFMLTGCDSRGNATNTIDPKQNTAVNIFDGASRNLQELHHLRTGGSGSNAIASTITTKMNYDGNSRLTTLTDNNNGVSTYTYDTLDRQTVMTFHDGSSRTSTYDAASDIITYTDENGSVFTSTFDPVGRRSSVTITLATSVQGTTAQSFQYDGLSRQTFGRDSVGTNNTDVSLVYDSMSRVVEEVQTLSSDTRYVTHDAWTSYPSTDVTLPQGRQITMGYDALYRMNALNETSGGASIAGWQFFGGRTVEVVLGNGLVATQMNNARTRSAVQSGQSTPAWGDVTTDRLGYDGAGRMTTKRYLKGSAVLIGNTTVYDKSSNKLFERSLHAESRSHLYSDDDSMDRLVDYQRGVLATGGGSILTPVTLSGTDTTRAYQLDGLGNWSTTTATPVGGSSAIEVRTHNKLNEVTAFGVSPSSTAVLYDHGNNVSPNADRGNGNISDDGTRLYGYDPLNRITTVKRKSDNATIGQYTYDVMGRRVLKIIGNGGLTGTVPNDTIRFLYSGAQCVEERDVAGTTTKQYVWGQYSDELIQMKTYANSGPQPLSTGVYYLLSDLLYRSIALTDVSSNVIEAYDTDAYGNTLLFSGPGADGVWFTDDDARAAYAACRYVFTGREYDPETKNYFYRARYYQTQLGRFVGRDPLLQFFLEPASHGDQHSMLDSLGASQNSNAVVARLIANVTSHVNALIHLIEFSIAKMRSEGIRNLYEYAGSNPVIHLDPAGLAFKKCKDAIRQLEQALSGAKNDAADALDLVRHGKIPDAGHLREYAARGEKIAWAMDQVRKYCGGDCATAAVKAILDKAKSILEALEGTWSQFLAAISNRQFIRSMVLAVKIASLISLLLLLMLSLAAAAA
jgi:RHS repeat-associated protein